MTVFSRYDSFLETDVKWLGSIPRHWNLTRVKYISELTPKKPVIESGLECSFIPMEKLKTDTIVLDEYRTVKDVYDGYTYFADHDILMAKVTPCFENKNIAVANGLKNGIGFGSSEIYVIRTNSKSDGRYLFYRLQEDGFMEVATAAMTGAGGLRRVPSDTVNNFLLALPSIDEQKCIASFLDYETAKIDTLIEKQQQLIKLLKEKRQAVISHAVTKGLNTDAPMKDSGVEWLGEVPKHWEVKKASYAFQIENNLRTPIDRQARIAMEGEFPYYGPTGILNRINKYNIEGDYFLLGEDGDHFLKFKEKSMTIYVSGKFNVNNHAHLIKGSSCCLTEWGCTFFEHADLSPWLIKQGVGRYKLRKESLVTIPILVPPLEEQKVITNRLKVDKNNFASLMNKAEKLIGLLQERRTALISAAVTGKIDVRNWQPQPSADMQQETAPEPVATPAAH